MHPECSACHGVRTASAVRVQGGGRTESGLASVRVRKIESHLLPLPSVSVPLPTGRSEEPAGRCRLRGVRSGPLCVGALTDHLSRRLLPRQKSYEGPGKSAALHVQKTSPSASFILLFYKKFLYLIGTFFSLNSPLRESCFSVELYFTTETKVSRTSGPGEGEELLFLVQKQPR